MYAASPLYVIMWTTLRKLVSSNTVFASASHTRTVHGVGGEGSWGEHDKTRDDLFWICRDIY